MNNRITKKKILKYLEINENALETLKKSAKDEKCREIIKMAENYTKDAKYFLEKKDFVNSFGALNYAYGWIDCGVRLGMFEVTDNKFFTIK